MNYCKLIAVLFTAGTLFGVSAGEKSGTEGKDSAPFFSGITQGCTVQADQGMTCTVQESSADGQYFSFGGKFVRPANIGKRTLVHRLFAVKFPQPCNFTGRTLTFEYRIKGPVKNIIIRGMYQGKVIFLYNNWGKQFAFWRLVDLETGMSCDYFHLKLPMGDASKIDALQFSMGTDVPDADMTMDIRNLRLADAVY